MSKPQPILCHMPRHIKMQILENLNNKDKLSIRRCSQEFKEHVKDSGIRYKNIQFWWPPCHESIRISWTFAGERKKTIHVRKTSTGYLTEDQRSTWCNEVKDRSYIEGAVELFVRKLKVPGVVVEEMDISFGDYDTGSMADDRAQLLKALKVELLGLSHKIRVERLKMTTDPDQEEMLHVLPFVKPRTLKSITWQPRSSEGVDPAHQINTSKLAELEQWRKAEVLLLGECFQKLPTDHIANFKAISYHSSEFSIEEVKATIQKVLRNENCDWLKVHCSAGNFNALHEYLERFEKLSRREFSDSTMYLIDSESTICLVDVSDDSSITVWNPRRCYGKHYYQ